MDHAVSVGAGQSIGDLSRQRCGGRNRQASTPFQPLPQGLALHVGHDEVGHRCPRAIFDDAGIEHRQDVGVLETRDHLDLAEEALRSRPASSGRITFTATERLWGRSRAR